MGELVALLNETAKRDDLDDQAGIASAWLGAALARTKKLPPLKRLMKPDVTPAEVKAEVEKARREHEALLREAGELPPPGYADRGGLLVPEGS